MNFINDKTIKDMKIKTLKRADIDRLAKEFPVLTEQEKREVVAGSGATYLGDTVYDIEEYLTMAVSGTWHGGFVNTGGGDPVYIFEPIVITAQGSGEDCGNYNDDNRFNVNNNNSNNNSDNSFCCGFYNDNGNYGGNNSNINSNINSNTDNSMPDNGFYNNNNGSFGGNDGNNNHNGGITGGSIGSGGGSSSGGNNSSGGNTVPAILPDISISYTSAQYNSTGGFVSGVRNCYTLSQTIMRQILGNNATIGSKATKIQLCLQNTSGKLYKVGDSTDVFNTLNAHLDNNRPIIVGVDHTPNQTINEGATDHFVVVTGRVYDKDRGQYYYHYVDTAKGPDWGVNAVSDNNRLYYNSVTGMFETDEKAAHKEKTYTITQIQTNQ